MAKSETDKQVEDATFLVDRFAVPPPAAAGLVARKGMDSDKLDRKVRRNRRSGDDATADTVPDNDETRITPVVHSPNRRSGGG